MSEFVLDNSVTIRRCFENGSHAYADHFLDQLEIGEAQAVVPPLWRYEVSAVLARAQIKGLLAARRAAEFIEDLKTLDIRADDDGAKRVSTEVHGLAVQYRLTSYDAAYLELALRRNLPLAALDEELQAACKMAGATVL